MDDATWKGRVAGIGCPFDAPRPSSTEEMELIAPLRASTLYLATNQTYRGQCVLILDLRHAARPDELSPDEWALFCRDLHVAESAIARTVNPDHINIAALGNVIPHLHWHIIPRYRSDPRWGAPIWSTDPHDMNETRLQIADQRALIGNLRSALSDLDRVVGDSSRL